MTIKLRSTIVVSSLLLALLMQPAAKADIIHVVAETNTALCISIQQTCTPTSFTADFTVTPPISNGYYTVNYIEAMTGTFNGMPVSLIEHYGTYGWLFGGEPQFSMIYFTSGGGTYFIYYDDLNFQSVAIESTAFTEGSWVNWTATTVSTPEPSALLLLVFGTGTLLVGYALFKNKPFSA
jgi:hypothetical protein